MWSPGITIHRSRYDDLHQGYCKWRLTGIDIYIDPELSCDDFRALLAHEMYHARGSLVSNWIRSVLYKWSNWFRYNEELAANAAAYLEYESQGKSGTHLNWIIDGMVHNLCNNYDLGDIVLNAHQVQIDLYCRINKTLHTENNDDD